MTLRRGVVLAFTVIAAARPVATAADPAETAIADAERSVVLVTCDRARGTGIVTASDAARSIVLVGGLMIGCRDDNRRVFVGGDLTRPIPATLVPFDRERAKAEFDAMPFGDAGRTFAEFAFDLVSNVGPQVLTVPVGGLRPVTFAPPDHGRLPAFILSYADSEFEMHPNATKIHPRYDETDLADPCAGTQFAAAPGIAPGAALFDEAGLLVGVSQFQGSRSLIAPLENARLQAEAKAANATFEPFAVTGDSYSYAGGTVWLVALHFAGSSSLVPLPTSRC